MRSLGKLALIAMIATAVLWAGSLAQKQERLNLNGKWKTDQGDEVLITQSGSSVRATFVKGAECRFGGTRDYYLEGDLRRNSLRGTRQICSLNKQLLDDCHLTDAYTVKFEATVDRDAIKGTYYRDYINYDEKNGHYVNCRTTVGGGGATSFSLTRICAPDSGKRCEGIGSAIRTIVAAEQPVGSASLYQNLQQNLGAQLNQLRDELCDDKAAQGQLDDVRKNLDSLNYVPGQSNLQNNLLLRRIEDGLRALNQRGCSVAPPSGGGVCPGGEKKAEPGDEQAAKFVKDKIKDAYDKAKETARELQEHGATVPQQISNHIKNLKKAMDFWDQIKAGSCVPADVMQTVQQVINDRRAEGHSNNCPAMCNALKKWYEKLIGQSNSIQGKLFMDDCLARCD